MFFIGYQRQFREHYLNYVTVEDTAASHICMFTAPGMPVRSLGHFRVEVLPKDPLLDKFRSLVERHRLHEEVLVNHPPRPGAHLVTFTVVKGEASAVHREQTVSPLPVPLAELEMALMEMARRTADYAFRAIRIESSFSVSRVHPGETVEIRLAFVNDGILDARIKNPAAVPRVGGCAISFLVWSIAPGSGRVQEYNTTIETTGIEFLLEQRRALRSDARQLELRSGERVSASLSFTFPKCDPGLYQLQLVYNSSGRPGVQEDLVTGGYHGDPISFEVLG